MLNIIRAAEAAGAEVIATECPTCHSGLEMHQVRAEKKFGQATKVKIVYFTQLLGMGLRTVGDLLRVPRGAGVRRLGQAWLRELDCALGRRAPAEERSGARVLCCERHRHSAEWRRAHR